MSSLSPSGSAPRTKPDGRYGRKPTTVRITRERSTITGERLPMGMASGVVAHLTTDTPAATLLSRIRSRRLSSRSIESVSYRPRAQRFETIVVRAEVLGQIGDHLRAILVRHDRAPADHLVDARRPLFLREPLLHEDVGRVAGITAGLDRRPGLPGRQRVELRAKRRELRIERGSLRRQGQSRQEQH